MSRPGGSAELGVDFDPLLDCLARFPKPLVAAVNGLAVGFGATLLLHCDLVVVDETAEIRMPFVSLGTCAEAGSSWLLPRRVGPQQASWMMLSGSPLSAEDAVATGFAFARAPAGHALAEALTIAGALAAHNVDALVANKALFAPGIRDTDRRRCGSGRRRPWRRWLRSSAPSVGRRRGEHRRPCGRPRR